MKLSDYPQELRDNPMIKFKEELVGGQEVVIVSYMVADSDLWKIPFSKETRGNTFDKETGRCISRSLPKFFNLGECEETLIHNLPWNEDYEVTTKIDGCCEKNVIIQTFEGKKTIKQICDEKYLGPIIGYDHQNKEWCVSYIISHSIQNNNNDWYEIILDNDICIKLTGNHLVWCKNRNKYIQVDELTEFDELLLQEDL